MLTEEMKKELKKLKRRLVDLSDDDAPEIKNWDEAAIGKFYRPIKRQVTIRLDADVLAWFKEQPNRYQTLINLACRDYMLRHKDDN